MLIEIRAERDALSNEVSRLEAILYEEKKEGGRKRGYSIKSTKRRTRRRRTGKSARKNRVKSRK